MAKSFKCTKCDRKFAMAAHLGRHMSTIHSPGGGSRKVAKPKSSPRRTVVAAATRGARSAAVGGATDQLVSDMQLLHADLASQRASLDAQIDAVADAMRVLGSATPIASVRGRGRAPVRRGRPAGGAVRAGSLKEYIVRVLGQSAKPMSPNEIGTRVIKAGYKTKSKDLTKAVSNALPQVKGIKRTGFGQYQKS